LLRGDEDAYERVSWEDIEECKQLNPPFSPADWIGMVRRWGAAEAARRLLVNGGSTWVDTPDGRLGCCC